MSAASAAQLKSNVRPAGAVPEYPRIPTAKSWSLPSQLSVKDISEDGKVSAGPPKRTSMNIRPQHELSGMKWDDTSRTSSSPLVPLKNPASTIHHEGRRSQNKGPRQSEKGGSSSQRACVDTVSDKASERGLQQPIQQHQHTQHATQSLEEGNLRRVDQQRSNAQHPQPGYVRTPANYSRPSPVGTLSLTQRRKAGATRSSKRRKVYIPNTLTVATLARLLKVKLDYLLARMRRVGMTQEASYDYILTSDYAALLAEDLGFSPTVDDEAAFDIHPPPPHPNFQSLPHRPPIVTIMGHVDHGKTTLLDTLRSSSVAKGEAGGITQHIGAFSVPVLGRDDEDGPRSITFLDTPGHAAFSAMRARGADVTDIVILVVAADDGIMPQTKEVINLLRKEDSKIQLIVAINKIDKPGANPESIKKALLAEGIQLEEYGGDIPAVLVSGLTGEGLPELVETISAVAEIQELRAEQDGPVYGHVLESNFHKGLGPVATVLVQRGCLKVGTRIISGLCQGKVRRMTDSNGKAVHSALPGMAVTVSGWKALPKAGDDVLQGSEGDIKRALSNRAKKAEIENLQDDIDAINLARRQERDARSEGLDALHVLECTEPKELKLVIKADVSGSCEALEAALHGIGNNIAVSKVISATVGDITESDVLMAKAANATILGFSVSVPRSIQNIAAQNGVPIFTSNVIYRLIEDVRSRLIALLPVTVETKVVGEATVLQLFDIQLKSKQFRKVAGCRVINGVVEKQKHARVVRSGQIVHEGSLDTMRQLKRDITEARKGMECGLSLKDFSDLQEGDLIQFYEKIEKPGVL